MHPRPGQAGLAQQGQTIHLPPKNAIHEETARRGWTRDAPGACLAPRPWMPQRASEGKACRQTPSAVRREPTKLPTALWTSSGSSVASAAARATAMLSRTAGMYLMSSWGTAGLGGPDGAKGGGGGGRGPKPAATRKTSAVMMSLSPS